MGSLIVFLIVPCSLSEAACSRIIFNLLFLFVVKIEQGYSLKEHGAYFDINCLFAYLSFQWFLKRGSRTDSICEEKHFFYFWSNFVFFLSKRFCFNLGSNFV